MKTSIFHANDDSCRWCENYQGCQFKQFKLNESSGIFNFIQYPNLIDNIIIIKIPLNSSYSQSIAI